MLGLSPLQAGLWIAAVGRWPSSSGSNLVPRMVRRVRPGFVVAGGLVLAAAGFALLARWIGRTACGCWSSAYVILSLGLSFVFTLAVDLLVGTAPPERAGAASAISETSSELGGALGIAVLGSVVVAVYRRALARGLAGRRSAAQQRRPRVPASVRSGSGGRACRTGGRAPDGRVARGFRAGLRGDGTHQRRRRAGRRVAGSDHAARGRNASGAKVVADGADFLGIKAAGGDS